MNKAISQRLKTGGNLEETLNKLAGEYSALFEVLAPTLYRPMLDGVEKSTDRIFSVEATPETQALFDQAAKENLDAAKSIPQDHIERIRQSVRENPGDTQAVFDSLASIDGKSLRQAKNSAIGLTRALYQSVSVAKAKSTGATKGEWIHSHGSKDPRHQHEEANGHEFDLATGEFLTGPLKGKGAGYTDKDNERVLPGQAYGCKCTFRLIVDFGVQ